MKTGSASAEKEKAKPIERPHLPRYTQYTFSAGPDEPGGGELLIRFI
jgi:hypothetical protein